MTIIDQQTRPTDHGIHNNQRPTRGAIARLFLWNRAWTAHHRLQRLDAAALRDVGLSMQRRDTITLAQVARQLGD